MKRLTVFLLLISALSASAQTPSERYGQKYDLLVSQLGPAGVGVETVLDAWEKADSTDLKMLKGRFSYYFTKAQTESVVTKPEAKYLGMKPLLTLKDSTGADVHYFREIIYDDDLYGQALKEIDKAVRIHQDVLDLRFMKANAYVAYEKDSPDMALAYLLDLLRQSVTRSHPWQFEGETVPYEFMADALMEYCYTFYTIGSPASMDAFRNLSEAAYAAYPDRYEFLNNVASFHLVAAGDPKTALKLYGKVLKADPANYTAIRNSVLAARKMNNVKAERKYLHMLVEHGPESERHAAEARIEALNAM